MTALASTDVTITLNARDRECFSGTKAFNMGTISFGDGALTYATGGVPMPAKGHFGMKKQLQKMLLIPPCSAYGYAYDSANNKIKIYDFSGGSKAELANGTAVAATTLEFICIGE